MDSSFLGRCLCGAIQYRINAEPITVYACHCTDCQRLTSGAFALSMIVPFETIELLAGTPTPYRAELTHGRVRRGELCGQCGSRLWGISQRNPNMAVVPVGALDKASQLRPIAHLWTRSALPWFVFPPGVPLYDTQPADAAVLVQYWRDRSGREGA